MTMTSSDFCEALAQQSSDISDLLAEHLSDYDEMLPHLFIADVARYVLAGGKDRRRIVEHIENAFGPESPDMENLIAVSFIEYIETREELAKATDGVNAPRIRAEWEEQRGP